MLCRPWEGCEFPLSVVYLSDVGVRFEPVSDWLESLVRRKCQMDSVIIVSEVIEGKFVDAVP